MARYRLRIKKSAAKELETIGTKAERRRIVARIASLEHDPRPRGCQKLSSRNRYRIRQGRFGILYSIEDRELTIFVIKIGDRKDIYKS